MDVPQRLRQAMVSSLILMPLWLVWAPPTLDADDRSPDSQEPRRKRPVDQQPSAATNAPVPSITDSSGDDGKGTRLRSFDPLSLYPRNPVWDVLVAGQKNRMMSGGGHLALLKILSFPHENAFFIRFFEMDESGRQFGGYTAGGVGSLRGYPQSLSRIQLQEVARCLTELPPSDMPPAVENLILVNFYDGHSWQTQPRLYDRTALPKELRTIFAVINYSDY